MLAHSFVLIFSVTRFGKISPLRQLLKVFGQFLRAYLVFGKLLHQLWHFYATGQIVIVVNTKD